MWLALSKGSLLNVTPEELSGAIGAILHELVADGSLNLASEEIPEPKVERPRNRDHGDWATNVAMQLAKKAGTNPRALAQLLTERLTQNPGIASAEIAGPGFINIRLDAASAGELARTILTAGANYGCNTSLAGQNINLEYVSANPTGPVHLGGARWAAVGDSLARIFKASGAQVTREYYFNDHGSQIDNFTRSLLASARGEQTPENGYGGAYIAEIADQVRAIEAQAGHPDPATLEDEQAQEVFRAVGVGLMFDQIKAELSEFRSEFDVFFHEDSLHESGAVDRAIARLRDLGKIDDRDGAVWLRTTEFGDDKDRVLIKSDGQAVRMSKRAGTVVTLNDLVDAVGVDAARYALARSSMDSMIDIDLDLLASSSNENPVYYVQYAHARTRSVARNAVEHGVSRDAGFDPAQLDTPADNALLGVLAQYPAIVAKAASLREQHRVARYLEQLAGAYHAWYAATRVTPRGDEPVNSGHVARLWLNDAVAQVLANGLGLLGVSAPERM